jgi:hypothetical protein
VPVSFRADVSCRRINSNQFPLHFYNMKLLLPLGLLLCGAAGTVLWLWPSEGRPVLQQPTPSGAENKVEKPSSASLHAQWTSPPSVKNPDPEAKRKMVLLPTGEYIQALNGAVDAPPLSWEQGRPYSEIIGIERTPAGQEWWVHADGTKSTTEMNFRSDLGRADATTQVAHPARPLPIEPEELSRVQQEGRMGAAGQGGKEGVKAPGK